MDYWHKDWQCPFFKWDERTRVKCERGSVVALPDTRTAQAFMDRHCADLNGWRGCSVAAALCEYYEGKEETV